MAPTCDWQTNSHTTFMTTQSPHHVYSGAILIIYNDSVIDLAYIHISHYQLQRSYVKFESKATPTHPVFIQLQNFRNVTRANVKQQDRVKAQRPIRAQDGEEDKTG